MKDRLAVALPALALLSLLSGCVSVPPAASESAGGTTGIASSSTPASPGLGANQTAPSSPSSLPPPPKPSLSRLTNRDRPHLDFHGAKIYADSITESGANGHVFVDGTELHQINRSFPIAVYAGQIDMDAKKQRLTLSGWPIVQTDSAFVQAQAQDTVIVLSPDRMAKIQGPARYVIGTRDDELFLP